MRRRTWLAGALLLAACQKALPPAPAPPAGPQVTVREEPGRRETHFSIESGACRITWTLHAGDLDRGVIVQRPQCAWPLERQIPLLTALLEKILAGAPGKPRALAWGRLTPDGPHDATLSRRLSDAAAQSPDWDARRGRPKKGDPNGFVVAAANNPPIYGELIGLFREKGFDIRLTSVEKVLIDPATRLPFDCQTWFTLTTR
jgi:hypothetical protein